MTDRATASPAAASAPLAILQSPALAVLGVVYGDIGTSPLYALREALHATGRPPTVDAVLGVVALIVWSLVGVVCVKYLGLILRADNRGEGGVLALMALARPRASRQASRGSALVVLGLFGAALLFGDGMITPAISVLSAVEGLRVATPVFDPYVVPLTVVILVLLFLVQRRGTARIGAAFGPVMFLWFVVLALLGAGAIAREPRILLALDPVLAVRFAAERGGSALAVLGSVFLVVTGAEALYADLGHFGGHAIRRAWFVVVFPGLLLNYLGQGALILSDPGAAGSPFYHLAPGWALYPLVGFATVATVIASQAVISGAFSLASQAVQLGFLPRLRIHHTSEEEMGQIYVPAVNGLLLVAALGLVLGFRSSRGLAAAYGVAVSTTMIITTVLAYAVMRERWGWSVLRAAPLALVFLGMDATFLAGNTLKILDGGWLPLCVGLAGYVVMATWQRGRQLLATQLRERSTSFDQVLRTLEKARPASVGGTAVYLTASADGIPPTFLSNLKHNKALHELVIFLTVVTEEVPRVPAAERLEIVPLGDRFHRVVARYGFMQGPHVPAILARCHARGLPIDIEDTTVFVGRPTLSGAYASGMSGWRQKLFATLARNTGGAPAAFNIRPEWIVELGTQVEA